MREAINKFLDYLENEKRYSPRTIEGYGLDLLKFNNFLNYKFGKKSEKLKNIRRDVILAFLKRPLKNGEKPTPAYRNRRLSILKSFCKFLVREKLLKENPTIGLEWAKVNRRDTEFLTFTEYQRMMSYIAATTSTFYKNRDLAIIATLYNTGLRLNELVSLNIDNIDFESKLFKNIQRKGGDKKNLPVNREVFKYLRLWLAQREKLVNGDEPALFISDRKKRIHPRSIEILVDKYAAECGLKKKVTPHIFRHSHCTEILNRGASIATAKELLNHANISTTARYSHTTDEAMRKAVEALAKPLQTGGNRG